MSSASAQAASAARLPVLRLPRVEFALRCGARLVVSSSLGGPRWKNAVRATAELPRSTGVCSNDSDASSLLAPGGSYFSGRYPGQSGCSTHRLAWLNTWSHQSAITLAR